MPDAPAERPTTTRSWRALVVVYGTLGLLLLAFPGAIADWLRERDPDGLLTAPLAALDGLDRLSTALGIAPRLSALHAWLRAPLDGF